MSARVAGRAGLTLGVSLAVLAPLIAFGPAGEGRADVVETDSAVTVTGTGAFSGLTVSVNQTKDLVNQNVQVSWTGGPATLPLTGGYSINFVQIMQCWSEPGETPTREQCQFGGIGGDTAAGENTGSRQITLPAPLVDAAETQYPGPPGQPNVYVPFDSVSGETTTGAESKFFDANTTNEIPYGRTNSDGTGKVFFEAQTGLEAPGLGCGQVQDGDTAPKPCWLVIVPRNDLEVDGSVRTASAINRLQSSPLSSTNWKNRIEIPLEFVPLGQACPIGRAEVPTLGTELVSEAMQRWQPALCAGGQQNFGFSTVSDETARRQLTSGEPTLSFVTRGLPTAEVVGAKPVYAPVSLSGLAVTFNIESQSSTLAPSDVRIRDGRRFEGMKLTPRLLLKLVSQSYGYDAGTTEAVANNPFDLSRDPEFLELNPEFKGLLFPSIAGMLLPLNKADAIVDFWAYIKSDAEAVAFLNGAADPWGMVINPAYKGMDLPRDDFPKRDLVCRTIQDIPVELCTLDKVPYSDGYSSGARSASRGDRLSRLIWDPFSSPPAWKKTPPQLAGKRAVLALVETASADRFKLPVAALRNAAGQFVTPTQPAMLSAYKAMTPDADTKLLRPDVATKVASAYPLTEVVYAATVPELLTKDAGASYARLIRYVAGEGQTLGVSPGQLPFGYAPLPDVLRAQATAAAAAITKRAGQPVSTPTPTPTPTDGSEGVTDPGPGTVPVSEPTPETAPSTGAVSPTAAPTASPSTTPVAVTAATPSETGGTGRVAVLGALILGAAALLGRLVAPLLARR